IAQTRGKIPLADGGKMPGARFFPEARLNFAQNVLRGDDDALAVIFQPEIGPRVDWTMGELRDFVSRFQAALVAAGVGSGDRVAAMMPNLPQTMGAMLATASLGAIWSSASPDFGVEGVLDRFGQIEPKVFIACAGYTYAGKFIDTSGKVAQIAAGLPGVVATVLVAHAGDADAAVAKTMSGITLDNFLKPHKPGPIDYIQLPFDHPLYILFSSGTTGRPKCIVHSAGGILLKHLEEHQLQSDIKPGDRLL
ncbi:MAG: AMP-binding protein, partial [Hyphomicrobiales bacterium]